VETWGCLWIENFSGHEEYIWFRKESFIYCFGGEMQWFRRNS